MLKQMNTKGYARVLTFFCYNFLALFFYRGLRSGSPIRVPRPCCQQVCSSIPCCMIIGFVLVTAVINLFVGSLTSKWMLLGPIFIPMLYFVDATRSQAAEQAKLWGIQRFELMQVHNLSAWQAHLETLKAMKQAGEILYLGVTTSYGRRHRHFEQIMQDEDLDFVQLTYNLTHREVEQRLLPLARERGIAVIANRPYDAVVH